MLIGCFLWQIMSSYFDEVQLQSCWSRVRGVSTLLAPQTTTNIRASLLSNGRIGAGWFHYRFFFPQDIFSFFVLNLLQGLPFLAEACSKINIQSLLEITIIQWEIFHNTTLPCLFCFSLILVSELFTLASAVSTVLLSTFCILGIWKQLFWIFFSGGEVVIFWTGDQVET